MSAIHHSSNGDKRICGLCFQPIKTGERVNDHHPIYKSEGGIETVEVHQKCHIQFRMFYERLNRTFNLAKRERVFMGENPCRLVNAEILKNFPTWKPRERWLNQHDDESVSDHPQHWLAASEGDSFDGKGSCKSDRQREAVARR